MLSSRCADASIVPASGTRQLQAIPPVVGQRLSPGKPTRSAVATMVSNDLVVGEHHRWDRVTSGIAGKRACEVR